MGPDQQEKLLSWLVSGGGLLCESVDPFRQGPGGERGIFATSAIAAGTDLISVPTDLCLQVPQSSADAARSAADPAAPTSEAKLWLAERVEELGQFLAVVLLLIAEMAAADSSYYAPEVAVLPASHSCLLAWSDEEAQLLQGETRPPAGCSLCPSRCCLLNMLSQSQHFPVRVHWKEHVSADVIRFSGQSLTWWGGSCWLLGQGRRWRPPSRTCSPSTTSNSCH